MKAVIPILLLVGILVLSGCESIDFISKETSTGIQSLYERQCNNETVTITAKAVDEGMASSKMYNDYKINLFTIFTDSEGYKAYVASDKRYFERGTTYTVTGVCVLDDGHVYVIE